MIVLAYIFSGLSLLMSFLLFFQAQNPIGWFTLFPKLFAAALSPHWAIIGAAGAVLGWVYGAPVAVLIGTASAGIMIWYVYRCTRDHKGFENAFGSNWSDQIPPESTKNMVQKRWRLFLKMKATPEPIWERDIPFWTVPGSDRQLLCDIWRPADGEVSGLVFVYLHGGAWSIGDKDMLTRPFFRHLVGQGHTVMDVAYRLCPEVNIFDMLADVKRAVAWMKANADLYGVNPEKLVLGGASAGGHLSLLAAYTPGNPELTPEDLKDADQSVCGVISYYGPTDLLAAYHHENQQISVDFPTLQIGEKFDFTNRYCLDPEFMRFYAGRLDMLLGGHPEDALSAYQIASPDTHVCPECPPTLLIQGQQDFITPVEATCALYTKLVESGVPAINLVYPWTDHAFDMAFPQVNPAAQSALYDVDRFLALLSIKG